MDRSVSLQDKYILIVGWSLEFSYVGPSMDDKILDLVTECQ